MRDRGRSGRPEATRRARNSRAWPRLLPGPAGSPGGPGRPGRGPARPAPPARWTISPGRRDSDRDGRRPRKSTLLGLGGAGAGRSRRAWPVRRVCVGDRAGRAGPRDDAGPDRPAGRDGQRRGRRTAHGAGARRGIPPGCRPICRARLVLRGIIRRDPAGLCRPASLQPSSRTGRPPRPTRGLRSCPFLRGFANLDFRRAERVLRYRPMTIVEGGATLADGGRDHAPAVALFGDHRAMLGVLIAHAFAFVLLSHLIAGAALPRPVLAPGAPARLAVRRASHAERRAALLHLLRRPHDRGVGL